MELFFQTVLDGVAAGAIYAALGLALVIIFRSTELLNFAQGDMAMFSTYVAWQLVAWGLSLWLAVLVALAVSFVGGAIIERVVIRPIEGDDHLPVVIVTLGLFLAFNSLAGGIWGFESKNFPSIFPGGIAEFAGLRIAIHSLGVMGVLVVVALLLYLLYNYTKVGLAMRATTSNPESARLVGVRTNRMLMLGWGLAATLGALAGVLLAPRLFLEPNMMFGVLLYAFAGATLGGFDSLPGAMVGGVVVGVSETLAGTYVDWIGSELKILVPLTLIVLVLLVRPAGLFGSREVVRA